MQTEPGNLLRVESSQVCRGRWRGSKPTNATCLFLRSGRHTSLKAAGFKSSVALGENGIKGWTINLPYSQVTGHLRAGILMGPLPPLLSSWSRCVIHRLSFRGSVFILLLFLCFCFLTVFLALFKVPMLGQLLRLWSNAPQIKQPSLGPAQEWSGSAQRWQVLQWIQEGFTHFLQRKQWLHFLPSLDVQELQCTQCWFSRETYLWQRAQNLYPSSAGRMILLGGMLVKIRTGDCFRPVFPCL